MNPRLPCFADYGGRGIAICDEWSSFARFLSDMGPRPAGTSLERTDNSLGYCAANCRWATRAEQNSNHRRNVRLSFGGHNRTISQWAEALGMNRATLNNRIIRGWPLERALTEAAQ